MNFPKDLVILTEKELAEKMLDKQSFYADIIKNGVKTYEAA
jgi:hypothetical protein